MTELLKNSIVAFNKTNSIARFLEIETDGEFIFQQLYSRKSPRKGSKRGQVIGFFSFFIF
ncbi:hypothetical protein B1J93_01980 [Leptospira kirschneri serovar Pomona]|uniref:Uncharacterized protein n=1 Tax=Leptospira kirschneri serovar Pomona TaxID=561005 RepID=A0A1T1E236_9LEPT|nr:hypothetical protein B1J93_01980 [Leptospira kirschneri serovar Pomona]